MDRIASIDLPVLLLHGERDVLVPLTAARQMVTGRSGWHLEVARDIGHAPMLEAPVWTALRIEEWLDGPGSAVRDRVARPVDSASPVS